MLVYGRNVARELLNKNEKVLKIILQEGFDDKSIISLIENKNIKVEYKQKEKLIIWQKEFIRVYYYPFRIISINQLRKF